VVPLPPTSVESWPDDDAAETPPRGEGGAWLSGFVLGLLGLGALAAALVVGLLMVAGAPPRAILLLGVDERPDEQQRGIPGHTDTIAVVVMQPPGGATLISFPRDLWVTIPGYGEQRLNVAYPLGAQSGEAAGGPKLLERTITAAFGLPVDRWARVDFRGFATLVDALGGVEIDVPRTLVDETYPTEDYGTRRLVIPAGRQRMDGAAALAYVRTRAPDSDFGRVGRQQQLLAALREQALTPAGLLRLPSALLTLPSAVRSDLSARETLALLRALATLPRDRLHPLVIGPDLAPPARTAGGADVLMPRTDAIRQTIAGALSGR
jgi:polyisoprenyl-teichoic acid--peptidoglycan teichoic acid transferase